MLDVSVVIPHYNRADLLERVLASLAAQSCRPSEVIVVDNGSSDSSAAVAQRHGARVLEFGTNRGFSRAVNAGWTAASQRWILVLNNDVELDSRFLEILHARAESVAASFAVPAVLDARDPSRIDATFDLLSRGATAWRAGNGAPFADAWLNESPAHFPPLTAALVRKDLFQHIGGLDEMFESYLEDVDFGLRCALAGLRGLYVPGARAYHLGSATLGDWSDRKVWLISRNQLLLVAKHFPERWLFRCGWPVIVAQLLWGLVAMRRGCAWPWLRGKWAAIRLYSKFRSQRPHAGATQLPAILAASEQRLRQLAGPNPDTYWKVYFRLVR